MLSLPFLCKKPLKSCFKKKKRCRAPPKTRFLPDRGSVAGFCCDGAISLPRDQPFCPERAVDRGVGASPSPPRARRAFAFGWRTLSCVTALIRLLNPSPSSKTEPLRVKIPSYGFTGPFIAIYLAISPLRRAVCVPSTVFAVPRVPSGSESPRGLQLFRRAFTKALVLILIAVYLVRRRS